MSGSMSRGPSGPSVFECEVMSTCKKYVQIVAQKYEIDEEEILIGFSSIPPSDHTFLVYICLDSFKPFEYVRKDKDPNGRWLPASSILGR